jgi:hypothetical protein
LVYFIDVQGKDVEMALSLETTKRAVPSFHHLSNGMRERSSYHLKMINKSKHEETVNFFETFYPFEELSTNGNEELQYKEYYANGAENQDPLPEDELDLVCYLIENNVKCQQKV